MVGSKMLRYAEQAQHIFYSHGLWSGETTFFLKSSPDIRM